MPKRVKTHFHVRNIAMLISFRLNELKVFILKGKDLQIFSLKNLAVPFFCSTFAAGFEKWCVMPYNFSLFVP